MLHFVEASELALLVQFLSRHPELDGQGTGAEGCRLVEALDGAFGVLDVTVEDKVLAVGGIGVEVLTLSELDRDDGSDLLKQTDNFLLLDLRWDVFDKEVGFISFAHAALDGRSRVSVLGSDLIFSLGDMLANEEVRVIIHLLFMHSIDGTLGSFTVFKRDVALVRKCLFRTSWPLDAPTAV